MGQPTSFEEQIRANLPQVQASLQFAGSRLWLTFYLWGPPENLQRLSEALDKGGWVNVEGWEGGFLYPKIQADKSAAAIVEAAQTMQGLCDEYGAEILNIDADTSPDVEHSRFVTLYRSPS